MKTLQKQAQKVIPSGVNSPVRAFKAVGGKPIFIKRAKGAYMWDEAGKKYLDFCSSWGPLLFGHAPKGLISTLKQEVEKGTSYGVSTKKEVELAKRITKMVPSVEKVRLVSSGTEATMTAIRLARGFTGRKKILKLDGGYHGHVDSLLVKAGSGAATFGQPDSAGIPKELSKLTLSIPFNDDKALEKVFKKQGKDIAAFILEPVPANMGVVLPKKNYLKKVRAMTKKYGALLIFDEVITGFRLSAGGAQKYFGVRPDLTCMGKILGGGFPLAAFGGKKKIMDRLAPAGDVYQAGTLSGNPIAVSAALWMLDQIECRGGPACPPGGGRKKTKGPTHRSAPTFNWLNQRTEKFVNCLRDVIRENNYPVQINQIGSMFTIFFTKNPVTDYASAKKSDTKKYARFFQACLKQGLYIAPSQFEAGFLSFAQNEKDLKKALKIIIQSLKSCL